MSALESEVSLRPSSCEWELQPRTGPEQQPQPRPEQPPQPQHCEFGAFVSNTTNHMMKLESLG